MEIPNSHRAHYDATGNIVLPGASASPSTESAAYAWEVTEEVSISSDANGSRSVIRSTLSTVSKSTRSALQEGMHQYKVSIESVPGAVASFQQETQGFLSRLKRTFTKPVWIQKNDLPKRVNRNIMFMVDIVRFGFTFAAIFLVLFGALNYQSFWEIGRAHIAPMFFGPSFDAHMLDDDYRAPLASVSTAGLLGFLPPVGPPDDRIIIPKLHINVPLASPPTTALLNQDWAQVEEDIQLALEDGVVHYPGTARAGQAGNFFVTGHSSYYPWADGDYKTVFARLHELEVGDEYIVYFGGDEHRYKIQEKKEVKPTDVSVLDQPIDKRIGTLMTCTPVGTTLRRLILVAQEIDPISGETLAVGEHATERPQVAQLGALPI